MVTGSRGQLGRAVESEALGRGHEVSGFDLPELDMTDGDALRAVVRGVEPRMIVNCAAFTAVDRAESEEAQALAVNGTAVATLAEEADACGAMLVQISTDYVFDGRGGRPYRESDPPNPLSAYGRSKLAGESAAAQAARHLVVRTAWLFGSSGNNFVEAICRQLAAGRRTLRVVADQTGCPTYATDLAMAVMRLAESECEGIIHAVNGGATSWFGFATEIARQLSVDVEIVPISTEEGGRPAPRPGFAVLDTSRLAAMLGGPLPPWKDALSRYLDTRIAGAKNGVSNSCVRLTS